MSTSPSSCRIIDWTFFFAAWELKGRFPAILDHPEHGQAARDLYEHAQKLLVATSSAASCSGRAASMASGPPTATATTSCSISRSRSTVPVHGRQSPVAGRRGLKSLGSPCCGSRKSLPTTSPIGRSPTSWRPSRPASSTTSARLPSRPDTASTTLVQRFEAEHDDYSAIIVKALADRLAEAFAEYLHAQARRDWGFVATRRLSNDDLDRREVPRHPAGLRLSCVSGSQRETAAVRSARGARRLGWS